MDGSRFWAVVVGINHYELNTVDDLQGACPDALALYEYLLTDLSVPSTHISLLLSDSSPSQEPPHVPATRRNILSALHGLCTNDEIRRDDNILFYYAGRGTHYSFPNGRTSQRVVNALCPADRGKNLTGEIVHDISGPLLASIVGNLQKDKGTAITIILDCCYLLQTTPVRGDNPNRTIRSLPPLDVTLESLEEGQQETRERAASKQGPFGSSGWDHRACILLTACSDHEFAQDTKAENETQWRGCFTRALIGVLRSSADLKYAAIPKRVARYIPTIGGIRIQNPALVGARKGELVWFRRKGRAKRSSRLGSDEAAWQLPCGCCIC